MDVAELTRQLHEHPDCSTVGGPLLPVPSGGGAGDDLWPGVHAIPPAAEAILTGMLGGAPAGCAFEGAEIQKTLVHATYRCAGDRRAAVDLYHPADAATALAKTEKFALVAGDPAPPPALVSALRDRILEKEAAFAWLRIQRASAPAPRAAPARRAPVVPLLLGLALVAAGLLLGWRRRRAAS